MKPALTHLTQLLLKGAFACILAVGDARLQTADLPAKPDVIVAIDILLQPDATMLKHSAEHFNPHVSTGVASKKLSGQDAG